MVPSCIEWASQENQTILTLADKDYPALLLETLTTNGSLTFRGNYRLLNTPIGIVGSQNATLSAQNC